ncbi:hypothetical protein PSTG_15369 [Puccinia striiformis f. sp. tritici PST-78]|uniref:Uncharacterized protein n=1 Tax=Puccinia striiformis f. sp. tritici PST-78 TaxID=1165861 RepID=A0A0L0UW06_9BASI|nr:hypothetical protein PSTG_15369 [Puccinia striiformis f. sp. tritici PST-78]
MNRLLFIRTLTTNRLSLPPGPQKQIVNLRYANNPTELMVRVEKLARDQRLDLIIELIKTSSVQVATISVWTELFKLLIKLDKQNLSYKLFLELKRRQIKPDLKFFHLYFHLISTATPSKKHFSLDRLKSLWTQAQSTVTTKDIQLTNAYLNSLIHHGYHSEAFTLFNSSTDFDSSTLYTISRALSASSKEDLQRARELLARISETNQSLLDLRTTLSFASLFLKSNDKKDHHYASELIQNKIGVQLESNPYKYWAKENIKPLKEELVIRFEPGQLTTLLRMLLKINKFSLIRKLWNQIQLNPDLYLQRDTLDTTHCGLVMVAMGRCGVMNEVEDLICWMIQSNYRRLKPNSDTLDKAIQASWLTEDVEKGTTILGCLTNKHQDLNRENKLVKLIEAQPQKIPLIHPSNRALATLLQAAGRAGKIEDIVRVLETVLQYRTIPEPYTPPKLTAEPDTDHPETTSGIKSTSAEIARYWSDQFIWVATDLLDKLIARKNHHKLNLFSDDQIGRFEEWRDEIDRYLQSNEHFGLRSRIEVRAQERLERKRNLENLRRSDGLRNDRLTNDGPRNDGPRRDGPRNDGPRRDGRNSNHSSSFSHFPASSSFSGRTSNYSYRRT